MTAHWDDITDEVRLPPHEDGPGCLGGLLLGILVLVIGMFMLLGLRWAGIDSCTERGGTPIVHDVLSTRVWDVGCVVPKLEPLED